MKGELRTPEEIEKLKHNWSCDPCWDIYETEGFEAHREELKAWQDNLKKENDARRQQEILELATKMGISGNVTLAEYIDDLEFRLMGLIEEQNRRIEWQGRL